MEDSTGMEVSQSIFMPVRLDDGTIIRIETPATGDTGQDEGYIASLGVPSFDQFTETVKRMAKSIATIWSEVQPSRASVEFNLEVGFESGNVTAWLVKGSSKGHLTVTMEWEKEPVK
jgi:hypothetical protein